MKIWSCLYVRYWQEWMIASMPVLWARVSAALKVLEMPLFASADSLFSFIHDRTLYTYKRGCFSFLDLIVTPGLTIWELMQYILGCSSRKFPLILLRKYWWVNAKRHYSTANALELRLWHQTFGILYLLPLLLSPGLILELYCWEISGLCNILCRQ